MDKIRFIHPAGTWNSMEVKIRSHSWTGTWLKYLSQENIYFTFLCKLMLSMNTIRKKKNFVQVMNFLYHSIWLYCWCVAWRQINILIVLYCVRCDLEGKYLCFVRKSHWRNVMWLNLFSHSNILIFNFYFMFSYNPAFYLLGSNNLFCLGSLTIANIICL